MAASDDKKERQPDSRTSPEEDAPGALLRDGSVEDDLDDDPAVSELGAERYVFAAFFAAAGVGAFLFGRIGAAVWNTLAETPTVVRQFPQLLRLSEDERPTYTMLVGVLVAAIIGVRVVRKPSVRTWADGVASELSKVHWPDRELVTNGTIVVLAAGLFATLYIGLLDRLWGFVTMLVYGT